MINKNILLLLLVVYLLYIRDIKIDNFLGKTDKIKVAIVSMVTKQKEFDYWLYYHLKVLQIDHIILRVEDTDEYKELIDLYGKDRISATYHNKSDIDMKHNYLTIMDRQKIHVNNGIDICKKIDIDFIIHMDADELLYVDGDKNNKKNNLRKFLKDIPKEYSNIHLKNYEAVFPNMTDKCFNTNKFIDCKKGRCLSYANGKSIGRIKNDIRFHGPHNFSGKTINYKENIGILHFDSCTYNQWETKFNLLKDTDEEKMKKIPFPFYKNSIKHLKKCNDTKSNCKKDLKKYYKKQKIDPYYKKNNREFDIPVYNK